MTRPASQPLDSLRSVRIALRADLLVAMKARELEVVSALRIAVAALDNAEAVEAPLRAAPLGSEHVAGARAGAGSTEADRRILSNGAWRAVLEDLVADLRAEAERYLAFGRHEAANCLRRKADRISLYLAR